MKEKSSFSGKIGFILAAAGSAVGLGNLWRFPYLAAKYGGGSFLLIYLILAATFGFALMITEIAIGRKTGKSALYAFKNLNSKWGFFGVIACAVPIIILPYYCVIGGWVIKYTWVFLTGSASKAVSDDYFTGFISQTGEPVLWLVIFILATMTVILLGINKGIENISKILMPLLVILSIIIVVFVVTRPGAKNGIIYYLKPELSGLNGNAFLAALGQLFYSMSLAMGIMITYGSYLPKVFDSMKGGHIIGAVFFVLVLFAALTSAISLMETVVSIFVDRFGKSRKIVTICVTIYTILDAFGINPL